MRTRSKELGYQTDQRDLALPELLQEEAGRQWEKIYLNSLQLVLPLRNENTGDPSDVNYRALPLRAQRTIGKK
jgi:hypothetical protein